MSDDTKILSYFQLRRVNPNIYADFVVPSYLLSYLPEDKDALIIDFGCGFGQILLALKRLGYSNIAGVDIDPEAIEFLSEKGIKVYQGLSADAAQELRGKASLVIASHVIEHFPKSEIVPILVKLRSLLSANGEFFMMVPNAQSFTGAYWAYEDFTHQTLFTAGSVYFVLSASGFCNVRFVDVDCTVGQKLWIRIIRKLFLRIYKENNRFWNFITGSSYHRPSEIICSYEIKVVAENP